jgi:hypothetical protein
MQAAYYKTNVKSSVSLEKSLSFRVKLPRLQLSHGRLRRRPQVGFSLEKTLSIPGEADEAAAESREAEEKAKKLWLFLVKLIYLG